MLVSSIDDVGYGVINLSQGLFGLHIGFPNKVLLDLKSLLLVPIRNKFVLAKSEFFRAEFPWQTPEQLARDDGCPAWTVGGEYPLGEFFGQIIADFVAIQAIITVRCLESIITWIDE